MKKFFAAALFALLGTGAFAQTAPGTVVVSGSLGFNTYSIKPENSTNDQKTTDFSIGPQIGYFINEGLELGLSLHYSRLKNTYEGGDNSSVDYINNGLRFKPYLKKHFMVSEKVAFTGSVFAGYAVSKTKRIHESDFISDAETKYNSFDVGVVPGIIFFPTEKIGLSAALGSLSYMTTKVKPLGGEDGERTENQFGLNLSSGLNLGFSYYISR